MVDSVNFNPFTGQAFTTEELNHLDTNGDGQVSISEFDEGYDWLSKAGEADTEGEVSVEEPVQESEEGGDGKSSFVSGVDDLIVATAFKSPWSIVKGAGQGVWELGKGGIKGLWEYGKGFYNGIVGGWKEIFKGNIIKGVGKMITEPIKGLWNGVKEIGKGIGNAAEAVGNGIANAAKSVGKAVKKIFKGW